MKTRLRTIALLICCISYAAAVKAASTITVSSFNGSASASLSEGSTNQVVYGFTVSVPANTTFNPGTITVSTSSSLNGFATATLYKTNSATTTPYTSGTSVATATPNSSNISFSSIASVTNSPATTYYYYVVLNMLVLANTPPSSVVFSLPTSASSFTQNYTSTNMTISNTNSQTYSVGANLHWTGGSSSYWSDSGNWSYGSSTSVSGNANRVPTSTDNVYIGVVTFTNQPTVNSSVTINNLVLGTSLSYYSANLTLTVSYPLTVTGSITTNSNFSGAGVTSGQYQITSITNNSTITAAAFNIGDGSSPSLNSGISAGTYIGGSGTFTVSGDVTITGVYNSSGGLGPSALYLASGILSCNRIVTVNKTATAYSYVFLDVTSLGQAGTGTLQLNGSAPIVLSSTGYNSFVLSNASQSASTTVNYNYNTSGGTQTVYTTLPSNFPNSTYTSYFSASKYIYDNITFTGAATKQTDGSTLYVGGNWSSTGGKIDLNSQGVTFNNPGAQTITDNGTDNSNGVKFYNVTFNNNYNNSSPSSTTVYTKTLSGSFAVNSTSTVTLGAYTTLATGNNLTLLSDASGSAAVNAVPSTSSITGTVNVQRFITGNNNNNYRGYRILSCPVNKTSVTASASNKTDLSYLWASGSALGTTYYGAYVAGSSGFSHSSSNPTLYLYQESIKPASNTSHSFTAGNFVGVYSIDGSYTITTTSSATGTTVNTSGNYIPPGNGYLMYYIGPSTRATTSTATTPANSTLTATGYLNQGNITFYLWGTSSTSTSTLTYTSTSSAPGYIMVGNPYACSLDLHQLYTDNSSALNGTFALLDGANQSFVTYNASTGSSTSTPNRYVASGQGFFVSVPATSTTRVLMFGEDQKASTTGSYATTPTSLLLSARPGQSFSPANAGLGLAAASQTQQNDGLHLRLERDSVTYDECGIYFKSGWNDSFDTYDSIDMDGVSSKVFLSSYTSEGIRTSINALSDYSKGKNVNLYINSTAAGLYKLRLEDVINIDTATYTIWLRDNFKKDSLDISRYGTYNFNITSDTTSYGANRFVLAIERKPLPPYQLISFTGAKSPQGVQLTWTVNNAGNYTSFTLQKQQSGQFSPIYSKLSDGSTMYTYTDANPAIGTNTYRLQQTDAYNQVTYSQAVTVSYNTAAQDGASTLNIYPNPARAAINVNLNDAVTYQAAASATNTLYQLNIYNASGVLMMQKQTNNTNFTQDITSFKPGIYTVEMKNSKGEITGRSKFVKVE